MENEMMNGINEDVIVDVIDTENFEGFGLIDYEDDVKKAMIAGGALVVIGTGVYLIKTKKIGKIFKPISGIFRKIPFLNKKNVKEAIDDGEIVKIAEVKEETK